MKFNLETVTTELDSSRKTNSTTELDKIKILALNINSLKNSKQELVSAILTEGNIDILVACETKLDDSILTSELKLPPNYNIYRKDRTADGGGVLIAIKNSITHQKCDELDTECEIIWISITLQNKKSFHIASYYRPPNAPEDAIINLRNSLQKLRVKSKFNPILIIGDFNTPHIDWDTLSTIPKPGTGTKNSNLLLDLINDFGLDQTVRGPTRKKNTLDLCLTSHPGLIDKTSTTTGVSDHDGLEIILNTKPKLTKKKPRQIFIYSKADLPAIRQDLQTFHESLITNHDGKSVEETWTLFKGTLNDLMRKHIPQKTISGRFNLPWITTEIKRKVRLKQRLYNKARDTMDQTKQKIEWDRFKQTQKETRTEISKSYWDYINNCLDPENDKDSKKLWQFLKAKKNDKSGVGTLYQGDKTATTSKSKAEMLNNYFTTVFTRENLTNRPDLGISPHPTMDNITVTVKGVEKLLLAIKPNKASGPDEIPARILQTLATDIAPVLTTIFQQSIDTGAVPTDWTKANITPIHKKGKRTDPKNYRPVSLTSIPSTIMEHIISSQIMNHLESNKILFEFQHGFRQKRSCESQLLMTVDDITRNMDNRQQIDTAILDFAKAFDKVPHQRLLYKLQYYGLNPQTTRWIENFLKNRQQRVIIDGINSDYLPVTSGVPQGTVLGPILFLIFINDLPTNISSNIRLFADDCLLYNTIKTDNDQKTLQDDLDRLCTWTKTWQMEFNVDKCHIMHFNMKKNTPKRTYSMMDKTLIDVEHHPYLGLELDNKLNWHKHISNITAKAQRKLNFIQRNMLKCPPTLKAKTYFTLIRPGLEYCAHIWDPHTLNDKTKIERIQHKAARFTLNIPYKRDNRENQVSGQSLATRLGWEQLDRRRTDQRLTAIYKIINQLIAVPQHYLPHELPTTSRISHNRRLPPVQTMTNTYKYSLIPRTIPDWNSLRTDIANASTLTSFKRLLKTSSTDSHEQSTLELPLLD